MPITQSGFITADSAAVVKLAARPSFAACGPSRGWATITFQNKEAIAGRAGKDNCHWDCRNRSLRQPDQRFKPSMNNRKPVWPEPAGFGFSFAVFFCLIVFPAFPGRADTNTTFAGPAQPEDLTQLPLQQLMQIEVPTVFSASKFEQKATAAPSSVTVITSDEIKRYGWRTLGDILASAQGFYITYDRNYQ
jgi:hypothetical protein